MGESFVYQSRACNNVRRFHTRERIREETVGHHSANVCAILLYLNPEIPRTCLVYALMHDWPEHFTGDVPAPAKWADEDLSNSIQRLEGMFWQDLGAYPPEITEDEKMYLKLADMLDLVLSSYDECHRGNQFATELVQNGIQYIADMDLPTFVRQKANDLLEGLG